MIRKLKKLIALICVFLLTVVAFGGFAMADETQTGALQSNVILVPDKTIERAHTGVEKETNHAYVVTLAASLAAVELASDEADARNDVISIPYSLPEDTEVPVSLLGYTEIPIYINDTRAGATMKIGNNTYVPIGEFCKAIGFEVEADWDQESNTAIYTGQGIEIVAEVGQPYLIANGRCLHSEGKIININGTIVVPIRELAFCFGLDVSWDDASWSVNIDSAAAKPLESASSFYNDEDLYWLSRIIFAEAGNQPLDGMLGVGNVVLNRVVDPSCPDTVYDVIFDDRFGVQFSVTENGSIYLEPTEEAINAAKMCLEGYNPVGNSMFFVNPVIGASSWFQNTRVFVASIGEHDFYA